MIQEMMLGHVNTTLKRFWLFDLSTEYDTCTKAWTWPRDPNSSQVIRLVVLACRKHGNQISNRICMYIICIYIYILDAHDMHNRVACFLKCWYLQSNLITNSNVGVVHLPHKHGVCDLVSFLSRQFKIFDVATRWSC